MDSTDLAQIRRRVRVAYEFGRLRLALVGILPVVLIVAIAASVTHRPIWALWLGIATVTMGATMLWYGREPQRAVLSGVSAGLVPLVLALCANHIHACGPDGCSALCVPACALGGAVAGLAVARVATQRRASSLFWLPASGLAVLTGAMGCACVAYTGVAALAVGFGVGMFPGLLRKAFGGSAQ